MDPEITPDAAAMGTGIAGLGMMAIATGKWLLDRLAGGWREIRAKAQQAEVAVEAAKVEVDAAASAEWKAIVADLRAEMARRDKVCDEQMRQLRADVDELRDALHQRDRIIVALADRRRLPDELRALLLTIAPAAEPDPKDHHQ